MALKILGIPVLSVEGTFSSLRLKTQELLLCAVSKAISLLTWHPVGTESVPFILALPVCYVLPCDSPLISPPPNQALLLPGRFPDFLSLF